MSNLRAVVFDLDDTLYAESEFVESGFRSVANWAALKWDLKEQAVFDEFVDLQLSSHGRVFNAWLSVRSLEESHAAEMVTVYRNHPPEIHPFPEVRSTIQTLRKKYRIGLVSDGFLATQKNKFQALELADLFDAVVFSDTFGRAHWKPDRKPFITVLEELQVAANNAIYIADNPTKDFLGARRAGMKSIRYRNACGVYSKLEPQSEEQTPNLEVANWGGFLDAINRIG